MSTPYLGEIVMFGGNFAPRSWAMCNGQLLSIPSNDALFSLLGTIYGGDGRNTFGLPELRGRLSMHAGNGPGLTPRTLGQKGGSETNTLNANNLPSHNHAHAIQCNAQEGNADSPSNRYLAAVQNGVPNIYSSSQNATMAPQNTGNTGGGSPVNNLQPYLCVTYIICLQGIYPSRN